MAEPSAIVLGKVRLRVEAKVVRYPEHLADGRARHGGRVTEPLGAAGIAAPR
ncbi:hypothetical protein [Sorangium sp. So ce1182]|uniref:hypothetical protein n=1 Tax=Sorangium sp. So ce1182 TaxID=3133334 RepID=UPI003F603D57